MATIKIPDNGEYTKARLEAWFKNHNKSWLSNDDDLKDLVRRDTERKQKAKKFAALLTVGILVMFGYTMYQIPDQAHPETFAAILVLSAFVWTVTYIGLRTNTKNPEVFDSLRQFQKDWHRFEELRREGKADRFYLDEEGCKISDACRRKDPKTEKRLMKKFRVDHRVLTSFGVCVGGFEHYIPKVQQQDGGVIQLHA